MAEAPLPSRLPSAPSSTPIPILDKEQVTKQENGIAQARDQANGATVHTFDPDATPEQKAQQALKGGLAPALDTSALRPPSALVANGALPLRTDINPAAPAPVPTVDLKAAQALAAKDDKKAPIVQDIPASPELPPGAFPDDTLKIREIPDWFKIGWSGQHKEDPFATLSEIQDRSLLAEFASEAYYGQWFHNAAIIVFAVVASHFLTLFGGGTGMLIVVLAICATYYETSIRRTRRNARDDMAREVAKTGLKTDVESATWLNLFMTRFWIIYEPVLSATIIASVDQVLSLSTPSFLNSIRMTTFTLGTKPPRIDHVRTFPDTEEDIVIMEWKISFTPNDILDMTQRQSLRKVNPKIVLTIKIGVGPAVVGKDIIVEDLAFTGTMRIKIKLMNNYPHVQLVDLSFMAPPVFDFVLKPVGFDLSLIPGLNPFILSQLHATLGPMMYDPNVFSLNLEQMLSGAPLDTAAGVLVLTIHGARGTKGAKMGGGAPDPYVSVSIAQRAELAKTAVKKSTMNPNWAETKYLLLNNLNEVLSLTIKDWNEHRKDTELGVANFDLKSLVEDGQQENVTVPIMLEGKPRGEIKFDAVYYPVLVAKKLADGTDDIIPETKAGVVRLTVHQAKDLDPRDKQIDPFARVLLNDQPVYQSPTLKRTPNPVWEQSTEFLVTDKASAVIGISVFDDNTFGPNSSLGQLKIKLSELLEAKEKQLDWFPLNGAKSGRVRLSAEFKPVLMVGSINGAGAYTPPIGVIRVWFKRARDLKNVEALTGGKSDPYVRVLRSGIVVGRTLVIDNNLDPDWDEIVYIQVHSAKDTFTLDVMDYQHLGKDRSLGVTELDIAGLLTEGEDKKNAPWLATGKKDFKQMLKSDGKKTVKGSIEFEACFYPATHLKNVSFNEITADTIKEVEEPLDENASATTSPKLSLHSSTASPKLNGTPSISTKPSISDSAHAKADAEAALAEEVKAAKKEAEGGIVLPREVLLKAQSGVLAFQILSGELSRKGARLEVAFNSGYWPAYSTEPSRSTHCKWDEIGEFMITELDYATVTLKLNTAEKETREDVIASYSGDLNEFLESSLDKPATFVLTDASGGNRNTVRICCKYIPVPMELDPRESVNNSGTLRIDLLDGKDLPSADRSGKSDPFALFEMNGIKVHKSEVIKKTLTPTWNENFETQVASRTAAKFTVDVYDWDRVGADTKLGRGLIDLAGIEPFEQATVVVPLTDPKTNKQQGTIRVKIVFRPGFITRARGATSTFSALGGRAMTGLGGGVLAVGGGVVGVGASGVGQIGKGIGGVGRGIGGVGKNLFGGKSSSNSSPLSQSTNGVIGIDHAAPPVPAVPADFSDSVVAPAGAGLANGSAPSHSGTLSVTIVQLTGSDEPEEKKSISVRAYGKVVESTSSQKGETAVFNESFSVKTSSAPCELDFSVVHKKTFGSPKLFGTCAILAWDHLKPDAGLSRATVDVPLVGGTGELQVILDWVPAAQTIEDDRASVAGSFATSTKRKGGSRFSFGKREREASATPSD